ncbi:MAG: acyl-CoA dehydrogenase family protein [Thermoanaerobaculia bacterium]
MTARPPLALDLDLLAPMLSDTHRELASELEGSVERTIARLPAAEDDASGRRQAREILARLGGEGWLAYAVPPEHGGAERAAGTLSCCLIRETLAAASPLADAVFALQCLGSMPLALAGSEELRARWLPATATGAAMAAFAMTEAEAGSDVGAISTRAVREGGEYVLDGRKWLISNAGIADYYVVFASTDTQAGKRGLSAFLVPAETSGIELAAAQVLSAPHPLGEVALDGCRIPVAHRLGEEGDGFRLGMRTLDRLRPTVAAAACGMAARALEEARRHAAERRQFGRPLGEFQLIQAKLADMATELTAARLLTYRAAWESERGGEHVTLRAAMAKLHATEAAQRIVDAAVQILGGRGVLADSSVDHLYRSVRALRIYEGTSEIQQLVIARELARA